MPRGGKREGAGRKAGSKSKKTQALLEKVSNSGLTPLEYLTSVFRNDAVPRPERVDAAGRAAPYIHSKMPTAIIMPPPPAPGVTEEDDKLLDLYLNGLSHAADEG